MKMSNRMYDFLKWLVILCLPSLATLIKIIFTIWNLPFGNEISSTIVAINAFLGACLGISSIQYKGGEEE